MEISRYEETDQTHQMMVAAVDFISDHANQVWASLNVADQGWCSVFHGVTLNYEGHPLVSFPRLLLCGMLTHHTTFLQSILYYYSFYKHLLSTYYEWGTPLELGMWRLIRKGSLSHGDLCLLRGTEVGGKEHTRVLESGGSNFSVPDAGIRITSCVTLDKLLSLSELLFSPL